MTALNLTLPATPNTQKARVKRQQEISHEIKPPSETTSTPLIGKLLKQLEKTASKAAPTTKVTPPSNPVSDVIKKLTKTPEKNSTSHKATPHHNPVLPAISKFNEYPLQTKTSHVQGPHSLKPVKEAVKSIDTSVFKAHAIPKKENVRASPSRTAALRAKKVSSSRLRSGFTAFDLAEFSPKKAGNIKEMKKAFEIRIPSPKKINSPTEKETKNPKLTIKISSPTEKALKSPHLKSPLLKSPKEKTIKSPKQKTLNSLVPITETKNERMPSPSRRRASVTFDNVVTIAFPTRHSPRTLTDLPFSGTPQTPAIAKQILGKRRAAATHDTPKQVPSKKRRKIEKEDVKKREMEWSDKESDVPEVYRGFLSSVFWRIGRGLGLVE